MRGPLCSSGCMTGPHSSYGECLKAKQLGVLYAKSAIGQDLTAQKRWDSDLQAYRDARAQGIQPDTTLRKDVDAAVQISNQTGQAYVTA